MQLCPQKSITFSTAKDTCLSWQFYSLNGYKMLHLLRMLLYVVSKALFYFSLWCSFLVVSCSLELHVADFLTGVIWPWVLSVYLRESLQVVVLVFGRKHVHCHSLLSLQWLSAAHLWVNTTFVRASSYVLLWREYLNLTIGVPQLLMEVRIELWVRLHLLLIDRCGTMDHGTYHLSLQLPVLPSHLFDSVRLCASQ